MTNRLMVGAAIMLAWPASLLLACPGISTARFELRIYRVTFVPGQIFRYTISPTSAAVTYENDDGAKTRELWRASPTHTQSERLYAFLKTLPMASFRQTYSRSDVDDGFELGFTFLIDGGPERKVTMRNAWQPDLRRLCIQLNELLPTRLHLVVPPPGVDLPNDIVLESIDETPPAGN
jgi:hypothetical protein